MFHSVIYHTCAKNVVQKHHFKYLTITLYSLRFINLNNVIYDT